MHIVIEKFCAAVDDNHLISSAHKGTLHGVDHYNHISSFDPVLASFYSFRAEG
jgi:hypothetical protein